MRVGREASQVREGPELQGAAPPPSGASPSPRLPAGEQLSPAGAPTGSRVGAAAAMPRQPNLSLIRRRGDNNTVCRQGSAERGVPPGKTWCWARARAANT